MEIVSGPIEPQRMQTVYTQYELTREDCIRLIQGEEALEFDNYIEINSYTSTTDGSAYGGIDKDSQPGNMKPQDKNTYEDDNDDAPVFKLQRNASGNREISGNVFYDIAEGVKDVNIDGRSVKTNTGDGVYDGGKDKALQNVQVELMEAKEAGGYFTDEGSSVAKLDISASSGSTEDRSYETSCESGPDTNTAATSGRDNLKDARMQTDSSGNYKFVGYAPGTYLLKFTWGQGDSLQTKIVGVEAEEDDNLYVQQYKSTTFVGQQNNGGKARYTKYLDNQSSGDASKPLRWYLFEEEENKYQLKSNAIDDIVKRAKIDEKMNHINNTNNFENFKTESTDTKYSDNIDGTRDSQYNDRYGYSYKDYATDPDYKEIDSKTPAFDIGIEKLMENADDESDTQSGERSGVEFKVPEVSFGIEKRPEMKMTITKKLENVKVVLANQTILIDAEVDETTGELVNSVLNTKYLAPTENSIGVLHMEMDTELIHGSTLQILYKFIIRNESELDYQIDSSDRIENVGDVDKNNFYKFNETTGNEVTMTPAKIVDYLDNKINYDESLTNENDELGYGNTLWYRDEITNEDDHTGIYDKYEVLNDVGSIDTAEDTVEEIQSKFRTLTRGEDDIAGNETGDKHTHNGNELKAEEETVERLTASKQLANTTEDMSYDNTTEIIKIIKNGGGYPLAVSGDSVPADVLTKFNRSSSSSAAHVDEAAAPQVTLTPPTGEYTQYLIVGYTIIAIISLGILGSGVFAIRNVIKRKKNTK